MILFIFFLAIFTFLSSFLSFQFCFRDNDPVHLAGPCICVTFAYLINSSTWNSFTFNHAVCAKARAVSRFFGRSSKK